TYTLNIIPPGFQSLQNATNLDNSHLTVSSTLSSLAQPDPFKWKYDGNVGTPGAPVAIMLQGVTLQQPTLAVYDGNLNVVGTATATGTLGGSLVVTIPNPVVGTTYYFAVGTSGQGQFDLGSYTLSVVPQGMTSAGVAKTTANSVTTSGGIIVD